MNELLTLSATALAAKIRKGDLSSREALEAHIARIEQVNPLINAMVADRFAAARSEADAVDKRLKGRKPGSRAKLPPLLGVPCTVKECFALTGMPNASGLVARKQVVSQSDATVVGRLRAAGAIPMGVTNTSELCMWMETDNRLYGRTNNPYDTQHMVGGSSGGEGSIIASGASPFGVGSDVGGSIRMPAFFNGVFGHKPTGGLIPNSGQYPTAHGAALRYLTTGPLARRAEDLWPLINLMRGPDGQDDGCAEFELGDPAKVDLSKLKVVMVEDNGVTRVSDDLRQSMRRAGAALERAGAQVRTARVPALKRSSDIWSSMLLEANGATFSESLGNGKPISFPYQMLLWALRRSPHTLPAIVLAAIEALPSYIPGHVEKAVRAGHELRRELVELIGKQGVMLFPSFSRPAPRHYAPMITPFDFVYTAVINVLELPATQVPLGLNSAGLPLGVQVVGVHGNDHLTVAAALELERAMGGWVFPKNLTER
ncbi:MAG: amidase [Candidatus Alcyoniella australis]|nr:amidase [Candidatus Alcyoniella australis]